MPALPRADGEDVERLGAVAKCAPPLRSADEREALWAALRAGDVADGGLRPLARAARAEARRRLFASWGGITGCQTLWRCCTRGRAGAGSPRRRRRARRDRAGAALPARRQGRARRRRGRGSRTRRTSCARAALNRSASVRGSSGGSFGSWSRTIRRTRSPTPVLPGSRVARTSIPRPTSASRRRPATSVLPAPSGPSTVTNQPRSPLVSRSLTAASVPDGPRAAGGTYGMAASTWRARTAWSGSKPGLRASARSRSDRARPSSPTPWAIIPAW